MKISKIALLVLLLAGGLALMSHYKIVSSNSSTSAIPAKTWYSMQELPALQKENPKKVIVDVYTDWCRWCKVMDETTFSDATTLAYLKENYHLVKLNAETPTAITFKGKTYNYVKGGRKGYNQLAAALLNGGLSYPSFVVLDENLNTLEIIKGYKEANAFRSALDKIKL